MNQKLPQSFEPLQRSAFHAADRAWTGLGHFFLCQSLLALAWTQIYVADKVAYRELVLIVISIVGMAMGFQWALLGTRMWQYHLEYVEHLTRMWNTFTEEKEGPGAAAWKEIDAAIARYWRDDSLLKWLTGNQWILFTSPLSISVVHLAMLAVVVWGLNTWSHYIAIAVVIFLGAIPVAWAWKTCEPILKKKTFPR